jgi:hypothetical protein
LWEILSPVAGLHEGNAEVRASAHKGGAEVSSTKRSRKKTAFVTMLATAAVLLVGVNICNLYTISGQCDQIRDLKMAMDTRPAQLQQILALSESKACRGHVYVANRLAD